MESRDVGLKISYLKTMEVEEVGIKEVVSSFTHNFDSKHITVTTKLYNSKDEMIREQQLIIEGELYDELENTGTIITIDYEKLWSVIDRLRNSID